MDQSITPISEAVRWNDHHFLIMDKQGGMPVQSDLTGDDSLLKLSEIYTKRKLHISGRLDRPAFGLVVFCKTPESIKHFNSISATDKFSKKYIAIVEGKMKDNSTKELVNYHFHNAKTKKAYVNSEPTVNYKECKLEFTPIHTFDNYTAIEIKTYTGRYHQIRAQLSSYGHPIKGDVKYGARRKNKDRSIHLCAYHISFRSTSGQKIIDCKSKIETTDTLWQETFKLLNAG